MLVVLVILLFNWLLPIYCLQCYNCDYYKDKGGSFQANCASKLLVGDGGSAFAGCVRIEGLTEIKNQVWMLYGGYLNKQVEGRPPSCYHEDNADLKFDNFISNVKVATISRCFACDDYDGCNRGIIISKSNFVIFILFSILCWILN